MEGIMTMGARCVVTAVAFVVFAGICVGQDAVSSDWPNWRGPNNDGISTDKQWNPKALANAKVAWRASLGAGFSTVSVRGELLYTMGNKDGKDIVYCLKAKSGQEVWKHDYACGAGSHPGPRATPAIDGKEVYTVSREGHALCLDAASGAVKWSKNLISDYKAENIGWGISASPRVMGDVVVYNAGRSGICLNKKDGSSVWTSTGMGGYAWPVPVQSGGKPGLAIFSQKVLVCVDPKTGGQMWSYPWETSWDVNASDPIPVGTKLFITSGYGKGCALLDLSTGKVDKPVWQNNVLKSQFSTPVLIGKHIYGTDGNTGNKDSLVCLDPETGKEVWRQALGFASMTVADGKLIVLNETGDIFIAEASPDGYKEISSTKGVLPKPCWVAPVFCGGMIYCRNNKGEFAAVDVSK